MTGEVCFVDTETLGLDADHHPIWEVGLIDPDGAEHHWFLQVTPRQIELAHPKALEIGRFHERYDPTIAVHPVEFAYAFGDFTQGCHLAGAVVSFDEERLRRLFWREEVAVAWHYHLIDVEALAVGLLCAPSRLNPTPRLPWNSEELSLSVGVDPALFDRHTALGDCRWAKAIYHAIVPTPQPEETPCP